MEWHSLGSVAGWFREALIPRRQSKKQILRNVTVTLGLLGGACALCSALNRLGDNGRAVPLVFVLAVLLTARVTDGFFYGLFASVVSVFGVNYIFTYPYFQFDFAIGIFCWIFALLILLTPEHFFSTMPTLLSVYVVLDALLKLQISMDARRFGMSGWVGMLCSSLFLFAVSALTIGSIYWDWLPKTRAVGIALALDGLQNGWITAYTVRVRARKKHLTEHFGLDEEQDETSD